MNMKEDKRNFSLTLGQTRKNALDNANYCLAEKYLDTCEVWINNFLQTIDDKDGKIQIDLDKFYKINLEQTAEMEKQLNEMIQAQKINQWHFNQMKRDGENKIFAIELSKRLEYCWDMALKEGLFNIK